MDDASDMAHLGEPLQSYISRWRGKVEVVRSGESVYLARAGQVTVGLFLRRESGTGEGSSAWSGESSCSDPSLP